ncbi:hypothetical protein [Paraburkholderia sp. MM6662-R1]|uniref:hypothetical protein n=1 Tax=Paraburkholderia sp. MM6662-R1 TaxID=2991066 RepID=UPI003D1BA2B1
MMALLTDVWAFLSNELRYVYMAMRYLHARDGLDFVLLLLNGIVALYISLRLVFASIPRGATVERPVRWLRAAICCSYAALALRIWSGHYETPVEPSELTSNIGIAWVVYLYGGDLRPLWRTLVDALERRRAERARCRAERSLTKGGKRHGKRA